MKYLIVSLFILSMFISCSDDLENANLQDYPNKSTIEQDNLVERQKSFARILSKAVYNEEKVRSFIKEEALLQFDRDYDVFYPFIKDKVVDGSQTFREILMKYCSESELIEIENFLPLLNILVPDLSLFCEFNPNDWDTTDEEIAVISRDDNENNLFINGEADMKLSLNEVPGFPCLVIKNNERLEIDSNTKTRSSGGGVIYKFSNNIFDGSKPLPVLTPQTRNSIFEEELEEGVTKNNSYIETYTGIDPNITAYSIYKDNPYGYERDYIYYGITNKTDTGELRRDIREVLYRFRINPNSYMIIADQEEKDPKLQTTIEKKRYLTKEEIIKRIWTDGMLEFVFTIMVSDQNSSEPMKNTLIFPLKAEDVFAIEKVTVNHRNRTAFRRSKNTYTVDPDNLASKWIYPEKLGLVTPIFLQPWDLSTRSLVIHMSVVEKDDGQVIERGESYQNEFARKTDFMGESTFGNFAAKIGYGFTSKETNIVSTKVKTTADSEYLGTLTFYYYDPIVTKAEIGMQQSRYIPYSVSSGSVEAVIMPKNLRGED